MKMINTSEASPLKIGLLYFFFLILTMLLCFQIIGAKTILMSAMASKPYSVLLHKSHYSGLVTEYYESGSQDSKSFATVICFGDSNSFYPPDHVVPRNANRGIHLSGLLYESIENSRGEPPRLKFSEWAYVGASTFDFYCLFYEAEKFSPDLIIVPINWFSFGDAWLRHHEYSRLELSGLVPIRSELPADYEDPVRSENISALRQIEYKLDLYSLFPLGAKFWVREKMRSLFSLPEEPGETDAINLAAEPNGEDTKPKEGEFTPLWNQAGEYFPMKIEGSNPTLRSLRALSYVASRRGTKILFFVWPLDQEYLEKVGALDSSALERSILLVRENVERENVYFVDLSDVLEHEYFYDKQGHCLPEGRRRVAQALFPKVLEILD